MAQGAKQTALKPHTLRAYVRKAEAQMEQTQLESSSFLWSDASSERSQQIRKGQIVAQFWSGQGAVSVPGWIDPWLDRRRIHPCFKSQKKTFAIIQDYDNHKNIYKPEVMDSKLITHRDNDIHKMGQQLMSCLWPLTASCIVIRTLPKDNYVCHVDGCTRHLSSRRPILSHLDGSQVTGNRRLWSGSRLACIGCLAASLQ
jgi:hypothetical protein